MENHPQKDNPVIKRVLVSFDSTTQIKELLETVAKLAAHLNAELMGLYVEDINLLELSTLPIAREVIYGSSTPRRLERKTLERLLRTQARQFGELIELVAGKERVRHSLKVTRGERTDVLLSAASTGDLLIVERNANLALKSDQTLHETQTLVRDVSCSVILLSQSLIFDAPIVVLFENTEKSNQTLNLAIDLARSEGKRLLILLPKSDSEETLALKQRASTILQALGMKENFVALQENTIKNLLDTLHECRGGLFIFDATSALWEAEEQQTIVNHADCSVIFFR